MSRILFEFFSTDYLDVGALASEEALGTPRLVAALDPLGIASAEAFDSPSLIVLLSPASIASAEAFEVPRVAHLFEMTMGSVASLEAFGTPLFEVYRPKPTRPSSRTRKFSIGGSGDHAAGVLMPEGPDPLYDVSTLAPDLKKLPQWDRRPYDAWTTPDFRVRTLAWLADMIDANRWIIGWYIRERATQARMSNLRLAEPLLIIQVQRKDRTFETSIDWTAKQRDDATQQLAKLAMARTILEQQHADNPP